MLWLDCTYSIPWNNVLEVGEHLLQEDIFNCVLDDQDDGVHNAKVHNHILFLPSWPHVINILIPFGLIPVSYMAITPIMTGKAIVSLEVYPPPWFPALGDGEVLPNQQSLPVDGHLFVNTENIN